MQVEKLKYTIWAADAERAAKFYQTVFGAGIVRQNPHITELSVAGGLIAIPSLATSPLPHIQSTA